MNFLTTGTRLRKKATKMFNDFEAANRALGDAPLYDGTMPTKCSITMDECKQMVYKELLEDAKWGFEAMMKVHELGVEMGAIQGREKQCFMITIRPDSSKCTFIEFYEQVRNFVARDCFTGYTLSFEQKGISEETLGEGFHVHIVAKMKQRSCGEVARDTCSTFKKIANSACIQVDSAKTPANIIQNYLIDYKAKDEHKIVTKEWDELWRKNTGLENLYQNHVPTLCLPIKPEGRQVVVEFL